MTNNSRKIANWLLINDKNESSYQASNVNGYIPDNRYFNNGLASSVPFLNYMENANMWPMPLNIGQTFKKIDERPQTSHDYILKSKSLKKSDLKLKPKRLNQPKIEPKLAKSSYPDKSIIKRKGLNLSEVEENELTKSPISGAYIIKEWNYGSSKKDSKTSFSKSEVDLNSIAASFVEITPQSRAKLQKIPNKIGPYECKLCKIVYKDAFELAMHNCPRVVHIEYKCSECGKIFNCPANLASHKRWHKPKMDLNEKKVEPNIECNRKTTPESTLNKIDSREEVKYDQQAEHSLWTKILFQQYSDAIKNSSSNFKEEKNAYNNNQNLLIPAPTAPAAQFQPKKPDWLTQIYSNYLQAATSGMFTNFSVGFPINLPIKDELRPTLNSQFNVIPNHFDSPNF